MNTIARYLWLLTICAFLAGCATYRPASIPGVGAAPGPGEECAEVRDQSDGQIESGWFIGLGVAALVATYLSLQSIGMN